MNEKQQKPDCQLEVQMLKGFDLVQEYADRLRAGASCDNCVYLETSICSTCNHLDCWTSYDQIESDLYPLL